MIYRIVPFPMTVSDTWPRFQGHGVTTGLDAIDVLCAQLTHDLFAIAKFLVSFVPCRRPSYCQLFTCSRITLSYCIV